MSEQANYEGWTILELMGHRRLGGYVREQELAGAAFLRIDVPGRDGAPAATQFYAPGAVYAITPTTEEMATAVALRTRVEPVQRWELPRLPEPTFGQGNCDVCDIVRHDLLDGRCGSCRIQHGEAGRSRNYLGEGEGDGGELDDDVVPL
jgi:hypothetical protein